MKSLSIMPAPVVHGVIAGKYRSLAVALGSPVGAEAECFEGGRWQAFEDGAIYWHSQTGAHAVWGLILDKWDRYGREQGFGYPVTDELRTPDGVGRCQHFQEGSIYWSPEAGAHPVYGAIRERWMEVGAERGCLGYPVSAEARTPGGGGRYQMFQHGSIYWS